ncbi:MAG: hypothetical protein HW400_741 [Candidatus Levybacteria bacterium]|nr:hypothetical protein [Candidatus Levybacteria bacterium]
MKIYHKENALKASKPEGINVNYYLFNEYEIHYNEQLPHSTQVWHHHEKTWETIYIIGGELLAKWKENGEEKSKTLIAGDLVETERTPHTFINNSNKTVKFIVTKQVLSGKNKKDILKNDKILD